jgi:hypothetical protein
MKTPHQRRALVAAAASLLAFAAPSSEARVTRIIIDSTSTLAADATYEQINGRAFGEVDPLRPQNWIITDLLFGLDSGFKAHYITSFQIVRPKDPTRVSGLLWHDVPNRGGRVALPADSRAAGDIQLNSAWQGDNAGNTTVPAYATSLTPVTTGLVNNEWLKLPTASYFNGDSVTGRVLGRIVNRSGLQSRALFVQANPLPYFPATLDTTKARLVSRDHETMEGVVTNEVEIPSTDWAWAKCATWASRTQLLATDLGEICLKNGFDGSKLYEVQFTARDPYVLGMGPAAFRDLASFLRNELVDDSGNANPLAGQVKYAIVRGVSQSGNFVRAFLHLGFNQDERLRQVYDGAWPIIAGRRVAIDFRWAQPDGVLELYQAGSEGPQWWHKFPDQQRGLPPAGILDRCSATKTCPKIIEHFGSAEVWALKLTPEWVGTSANTDIPLPDNVRRYYIGSSTHGGGGGGFNPNPANVPVNCPGNNYGQGFLRANPMPHTETVTALRYHFRNWVMHGMLPPDSQYPQLHGPKGDRNLVPANKAAMGFPTIPVATVGNSGWRTTLPETGFINPVLDYDWGPFFNPTDATGVPTNIPPPIKQVITMLVPRVDADGNELGGVPVVLGLAPLGTYLGWNVTAAGFHQGQICNYVGGMIPFARTQAERLANNDPRLSLEERYGTHDGYVNAVKAAAATAVNAGFLLPADATALINLASVSSVLQ